MITMTFIDLSSTNSGPNIDLLPSISSVSCTGNEKYFGACSFVLGSSCFSNALAGVSCVADTGEYIQKVILYWYNTDNDI